jgi:hypothetical protein
VNVVLGLLRYGFLALIVLFLLYVMWLMRKEVE